MRGGTASIDLRVASIGGLSPRARGNRRRRSAWDRHERSIPACAGEPRSNRQPRLAARVYPRVRGGTTKPKPRELPLYGLSPRARGNQNRAVVNGLALGLSPRARGNLHHQAEHIGRIVYPRVRGGTPGLVDGRLRPRGLSPRARGNRTKSSARRSNQGSIPACAGEPDILDNYKDKPPVYPRVRGGTISTTLTAGCFQGLSPRARGNQWLIVLLRSLFGSIPACAGEPRLPAVRKCGNRVYPRVRGGTPQPGAGGPPA